MTHLGNGVCIAAVETLMIFVRRRGAMLVYTATIVEPNGYAQIDQGLLGICRALDREGQAVMVYPYRPCIVLREGIYWSIAYNRAGALTAEA